MGAQPCPVPKPWQGASPSVLLRCSGIGKVSRAQGAGWAHRLEGGSCWWWSRRTGRFLKGAAVEGAASLWTGLWGHSLALGPGRGGGMENGSGTVVVHIMPQQCSVS